MVLTGKEIKLKSNALNRLLYFLALIILIMGAVIAVPVVLYYSFSWFNLPSYGTAGLCLYVIAVTVTRFSEIRNDMNILILFLIGIAVLGLIGYIVPESDGPFSSVARSLRITVVAALPHAASVMLWVLSGVRVMEFVGSRRTAQ